MTKINISRGILCEKVKQFTKITSIENFKPTAGWLWQWKEWNNIACRQLYGENWTRIWTLQIIGKQTLCWIYWKTMILLMCLTLIYSTLFYRVLLQNIHMFRTESSEGCKRIKQCVAFPLMGNMTGKHLQCLEEVRICAVLKHWRVFCWNNKNSLLTNQFFQIFLYNGITNLWKILPWLWEIALTSTKFNIDSRKISVSYT